MKSIMIASQTIMCGMNDVCVCGGTESMSQAPFILNNRKGKKFGDMLMKDSCSQSLSGDFTHKPMGVLTEEALREYNMSVSDDKRITRERCDEFAALSYERSRKHSVSKNIQQEIAPITIKTRKDDIIVCEDEEPMNYKPDKMSKLRPAFDVDGVLTAANASTISDGACCLILASKKYVESHSLRTLARIVTFADASREPKEFSFSPVDSTNKILKKMNLSTDQIDLFEINEAFSSVPLYYADQLGISLDKINVNGGAVSMGHPIGCSGGRIVVSLIHQLLSQKSSARTLGLAAICNGGGGSSAILIEI
eukprot:TRINITY_DN3120_c0_g7_i2.p1 TRINITY_DN3120_c0_g7~~TRINITY_DN3120_c0_g7_i2.p1  ORF type:complete len:309 (+),score=22.51 TRINITY_DN3120_c0_g7_i2:959-1885(+)